MQYTYTIKFKPTGQKYHGSRTAKDANPDEFWHSYFTSSTKVNRLIEEHGKESFEILDITPCPNDDAYEQETAFLMEHNCASSSDWLNASNNDYALPHNSDIVKQRMLNKYGVDHNMKIPELRENVSRYMKELWQDEEFRNGRKETIKKRYGVEHQMHSEEVKEKLRNTCIKKYGVANPAASEEVKEKIRQTFNENYGCHPRQTEAVKEKYKKTVLERYGVDHHSKTDEFKNKLKNIWANKDEAELEKVRNKSKSVRANDPIFECPHCKRMIKNKGTFNRWHNDNCKLRKDNE